MNRKLTPTLLCALLLGGCTMIPEYQRPASPVPDAWAQPSQPRTNTRLSPSR